MWANSKQFFFVGIFFIGFSQTVGFRKLFECGFLIINNLLCESSNISCITLQKRWGIGNCNTDFAGVSSLGEPEVP